MSIPLPPEPDAVRAALRLAVAEAPASADRLVSAALCEALATAWDEDVADATLLRRVVEGCRYEAFLWVMGDRRWSQLADTLAGRLQRRRHHPAGRAGLASPGAVNACS